MSIAFACEFCRRKYRVDDSLAGRKVKCKECGTELAIPSAAPSDDLYGLEEMEQEQDEAPLPRPRRPGAAVEPSPSRSRKKQPVLSAENESQFRSIGRGMLLFGCLSFVLPLVGLQVRGLHALPPEAQMAGGVLLIAVGGFLLLATKLGVPKALGAAGGAVACLLLLMYGASIVKKDRDAAGPMPGLAQGVPGPNFGPGGPPPGFPGGPNFGANGPGPGLGAPGGVPFPSDAPPSIHVTLSNGRAGPATDPFGRRMAMGVDFHADYAFNGQRPPGVLRYVTVIEGANKSASDLSSALFAGEGSIDGTVMTFAQADGPFKMHVEAQMIGRDQAQHRVSEEVALPWSDSPPPDEAPGFGPPGFPNNPGGAAGRPGFGPPPMPPPPRFGPRGRP